MAAETTYENDITGLDLECCECGVALPDASLFVRIVDESGTIGAIRAAHLGARTVVLPGEEIDVYCVDCRGKVSGRHTREALALTEAPS